MKRFFLCIFLIMLGLLTACKKDGSNKESMTGEELDRIEEDNKEKEKYLVIDVRGTDEYEAGHVKHAINIPLEEIESRVSEIEDFKDKNIVVVCNTGNRSGKAQKILKSKGFKRVINAEGVKDYKYTTITKAKSVLGSDFNALVNRGDAIILDFRDEEDFLNGHMDGAISTSVDKIDEIIDIIPMDKPVLTYCYTGNRSFMGAHKLAELGYDATNAIDGTKEYDQYELVK